MRVSGWIRQVALSKALNVVKPGLPVLAWAWRTLLFRTQIIAVTGSLGKTTTKECLAHILPVKGRTFRSLRNQNAGRLLLLNLLRVRPWHQFAVLEAATGGPGNLIKASRVLRPDLVVLLGVAGAHITSLRSLDGIAQEKMSLVRHLTPGGTVVVNGDEPRFNDLPRFLDGKPDVRVLRFGQSADCHLRVSEVRDEWPSRLSFRATAGEQSVTVETRLVGRSSVQSILGALLTAHHLGIPLETAARQLAGFRPFPVRMQPVEIPPGIIFIRDEYNGTQESFDAAFDTLARAKADRKVLIAGDFSDSRKTIRKRLTDLGRTAAEIFDLAVFVGESSGHSLKGWNETKGNSDTAVAFFAPDQAVAHLREHLRSGDLVLLKGRNHEHLSRLFFAMAGEIKCRKASCRNSYECDFCWELGARPSDLAKIRPL